MERERERGEGGKRTEASKEEGREVRESEKIFGI